MSSNNSGRDDQLNNDPNNRRSSSQQNSSSTNSNNKRPFLVEDEEDYHSSLNSSTGGCHKKPKVAAMAADLNSSNTSSIVDVEPKSPLSPNQSANNIKANFSLITSHQNGVHKNSTLNPTAKTGGSKKIVIKNFKGTVHLKNIKTF